VDILGGDEDLVRYMMTLLGYSLFGLQTEQKFWMWTGRGANGKGILARTMIRVLGDYGDAPSDQLYMRTRVGAAPSSAARPDLVRLQGVRFTYMSEPQGGQLNEELVKAHTGEDIILARDLYGKSDHMAQFPPTHKIIFLANELPKTEDTGVSMRRRARVIRFEQDYGPESGRGDMTLEGRIESEKQGIVNRLVQFARIWYNDGAVGLVEPQQVTDWSEEYISENDPLARWIADDCLLSREMKTSSAVLYGDYDDWCARHGLEAQSNKAFSHTLVGRFRKEKTNQGARFVGIGLKTIEQRVGDDDE
jgi:putative DNA primase/helicase